MSTIDLNKSCFVYVNSQCIWYFKFLPLQRLYNSNTLFDSVQGNNSTCLNTSQEYVTAKFKSERFVSFSEIGLVGKIQAIAIQGLDILPASESFVLFIKLAWVLFERKVIMTGTRKK